MQHAVVIYEDNHLLVVNKPAGMPVQGDATGDFHLLQWAAAYIKEKYAKPGEAFVGLVHRLDRPVSGLVVLARTSKALARMNEIFRERKVKKTYLALTTRALPADSGVLEDPMDKDSRHHRAIVYKKPKEGVKMARLEYALAGRDEVFCLYRVNPFSGRFHQIRAQLAHHGAPIVGDLKYGYPRPNDDKSVCLHAFGLEFVHPVRGDKLELATAFPSGQEWLRYVGPIP
jgi:23S rRNA pseudouridine1911/1915/1917 synthase